MNRSIWKFVSVIVPVAAAAIAYTHDAHAQFAPPPPAYVASYTPIYYNGYAHYLYRDHWYYRDHSAWRGYDREPGPLHDRRGEWGHHAAHHWR